MGKSCNIIGGFLKMGHRYTANLFSKIQEQVNLCGHLTTDKRAILVSTVYIHGQGMALTGLSDLHTN